MIFVIFMKSIGFLLEKLTSRDSGPSKVYGICNVYVGFTRRGLKSVKIQNPTIVCGNHTILWEFTNFMNSMGIHGIPHKSNISPPTQKWLYFLWYYNGSTKGCGVNFVILIEFSEFW